jgi:hypothetical protein
MIAILGVLFTGAGCRERNLVSVTAASGLAGQVYAIGGPAISIPPPPYEKASTIVVLDSTSGPVNEFATNDKGKFQISLSPGKYYLRVKESFVPTTTGPFAVIEGQVDSAFAYYNNGIR